MPWLTIPQLSTVFIHGLTGDREKTWKTKSAAAPWPQILLPARVPNARILTFGYDAYVTDWRGMVSKNRIGDHSMNLLTAIATHREDDGTALSTAQQRPERHLKKVLHCTRGMVFLGTPHHGAGLVYWAESLAKAIGVLKQTNPEILAVLKNDFEVLERDGLPPIEIICFFEELPLPGVGTVVPDHSAKLPGYVPIGIRSNYIDMTKFEKAGEPGFVAVAGELGRWCRELSLSNTGEGPVTGIAQIVVVPYASNTDFVSRSSIMERLKEMLSPNHGLKKTTNYVRVALHGLGGIGKTQIAINYAYWARKAFLEMSIFWVHASNLERFSQSILRIAQECKIPGYDDPKADKSALVKNWLQGNNCHLWLLILDNADDYEITPLGADGQLGGYIPECSYGSILVIIRNKQAAVKLTRNRGLIEVEKMTPTEASQLVARLTSPAAFIRENTMSVEEYLQQLDRGDDHLTELLSQPFEEVGRDSEIPNAIRKQCSLASDMLSLMSYFDRQRIPKTFLQPRRDLGGNDSNDWQQSKASADIEQEKAVGVLKAFSFITAGTEDKALNMHRLVQLATRKWLIAEKMAKVWAEEALLILSDLYLYGSHENRGVCDEYLPHAYAMLGCRLPLLANTAVARASLLYCISGLMLGQGQWKKAEEVLGAEHPSTLTSMANLASTFWNQGRWKEAEELGVQVKETSLRVLGAEHPDTLTSMANLASTFWNQGRWKEAEELEVQVKETSLRVLGAEHPSTLTSMVNLASTYRDQGRWKEAEELEVQVIETRNRVLGPEHPSTLTSMNNLAFTLRGQGRNHEAISLMEKCVHMQKRILGPYHPNTVSSIEALNNWRT
ncbi:uncharacterized protein K441DRAFT_683738 [Cenococcum geophilum 1.58]|uniref:uncharacterized protein n=1 Tax=Cenococcum geophilum 1.58 TaxID=794803 RepID=UPI00358F1263|nr:hypothetical protein K441DRAFT_683738 [Cenococcum geophilum 1.58]